jgi:hypothetical protein
MDRLKTYLGRKVLALPDNYYSNGNIMAKKIICIVA